MDSLILQTAIGLVFIFATAAGLVSVITESVSRYIGLRAEYLLRGLRTLLDGGGTFELPLRETVFGYVSTKRKDAAADRVASAGASAAVQAATTAHSAAENKSAAAAAEAARTALTAAQAAAQAAAEPLEGRPPALVAKIMAHPLIDVTTKARQGPANAGDAPLTNQQRRQLPSYISARSFAQALLDLTVPDATGVTTMSDIRDAINTIPVREIPDKLKAALLSIADNANDDVATFRTNLEHWYDDQMSRVSGWYKRHTRWVSLAIGVVLVLTFNLNVLAVARSIYTDEALRGSVVTQATQASNCGTKTPATCLQDLRHTLDSVRGAGLPIGWAKVAPCTTPGSNCNWFEDRGLWIHNGRAWPLQTAELGLLLIGWALMVIALLPGANFWFDILGRLGTLRSSGPKPKTA